MYNSKKQLFTIIFSIALVFLCIFGIRHIKLNYFSGSNTSTQETTSKLTESDTTTKESTTTNSATEESTTSEDEEIIYENINLTFAGNIRIEEENMNSIKSGTALSPILSSKISNSDFSMFNLQTAIADEENLSPDNTSNNYVNSIDALSLKKLNFSGVALANNYIMECGTDVINSTILTLDSINMNHTGAGNNLTEATIPIISEITGRKICIMSTTGIVPDDNWIATNKNIFVDKDNAGVFSSLDTTYITEQISEQKEKNDFIIVYMNCGDENTEEVNDSQRRLAHSLIDAGANLIIGCSPNMVQGIEYYQGIPIIYSLGTFLSSDEKAISALLSVTITEDNNIICSLLPCSFDESLAAPLDDESTLDFYEKINELSNEMYAQISEDGTISEIPQ